MKMDVKPKMSKQQQAKYLKENVEQKWVLAAGNFIPMQEEKGSKANLHSNQGGINRKPIHALFQKYKKNYISSQLIELWKSAGQQWVASSS